MWPSPVILSLGPIQIRWYGLVYVLGLFLTYYFLRRDHRRLRLKKKEVDDLILWIMIGMIIGARILHFVFSNPGVFLTDPLELIKVWHGGMSFFGGLFGIILASFLFLRNKKTSFYPIADIAVVIASVSLGFGRLANLINQELLGTVTSVPWCINFTVAAGCRHPYQIYASLSHFVLFAILLFLYRSKPKRGTTFFAFLFFYSVFRFLTDFWREDPRFLGFTVWQYISLVVALVSLHPFLRRISKPGVQ